MGMESKEIDFLSTAQKASAIDYQLGLQGLTSDLLSDEEIDMIIRESGLSNEEIQFILYVKEREGQQVLSPDEKKRNNLLQGKMAPVIYKALYAGGIYDRIYGK